MPVSVQPDVPLKCYVRVCGYLPQVGCLAGCGLREGRVMPGLFSISQDPALSMAPERHRQLPRGGDTQVCLGCIVGCGIEETCLEQGPEGQVDALN